MIAIDKEKQAFLQEVEHGRNVDDGGGEGDEPDSRTGPRLLIRNLQFEAQHQKERAHPEIARQHQGEPRNLHPPGQGVHHPITQFPVPHPRPDQGDPVLRQHQNGRGGKIVRKEQTIL